MPTPIEAKLMQYYGFVTAAGAALMVAKGYGTPRPVREASSQELTTDLAAVAGLAAALYAFHHPSP